MRDIILFQTAPHNPSGLDPTVDEWEQIAGAVAQRELLPFFDIAFLGFAAGLREDLCGIYAISRHVSELLIASSYSKSFALYNSRVGALSMVGHSQEAVRNVYSYVRHLIRSNYSNPPLHGAAVVAEILTDASLHAMWLDEIAEVRDRIRATRQRLVTCLGQARPDLDWSYILDEHGLFTELRLSAESIREINELHAIHMASTGLINVTAMTDGQLEQFCKIVGPHLL